MRLKRLSDPDYTRLTADTGLASSNIEAGREHFVHGRNFSDVARDAGISAQRVRGVALEIEKLYFERAMDERFESAQVGVERMFPHQVAAALEQWGRIYEQASDGVRAQMSASVTQALLRGLRPRAKQRTGS